MQRSLFLPWYSRLFRRVARPFFRFLFRLLGAYLVAPNHISIFEPPLLGAFWPSELEIAAAVEILERPIQSEIMRLYGTVHVHRGQLDRSLITALLERLANGRPVLIFPEGMRTKSPGLKAGNTGAAYLAAKANVSLIPVGITGTYRLWEGIRKLQRPEIKIRIGPALEFPRFDLRSPERKRTLKVRTNEIMRAIARLLPPDHQGDYAS
jgi:1-acyl-sn-glycerol-3-phosphate acyltransferase